MTVRLHSGPAEILASGAATCFGGNPLALELQAYGLTVLLAFRTDPEVEDVAVATHTTDDEVRLDLVNFDGPDGRGSAWPVLLGAYGEDLVFLHFRVFRYGRTDDRTVHYTLYRTSKQAVGWTPVVPSDDAG